MRNREKINQELNRRLAEVTWYREYKLNDQDLAKDFFGRIADYVNYIKSNRELCSFVKKLKNDRDNIKVNETIVKEGNAILKKMRDDFKSIKQMAERNSIEIKPYIPVNGALSDSQAVSLAYEILGSYLERKDPDITDLKQYFGELWSLIGHLEPSLPDKEKEDIKKISESYYSLSSKFQEKLRLQQNWVSFYRYNDYENILEAWKYYFDCLNPEEFSILRIELNDVLGEGIIMPSLSSEIVRKLEEKKQDYLRHISRFHNYLIDKLEERSLMEEARIWLWDNFGKVIFSMVLSLLLVYLLKLLGFTIPIDVINSLLTK